MSLVGAITDLKDGFRAYPLWGFMAMREIRLKYARSFVGPIWITLTLGFWVAGLSLLYGGLFGAPLREIAPYITLGVIAWSFFNSVFIESCGCLMAAKEMIMQSRLALTTFVLQVFFRNIIITLHHMIVFVAIVLIFRMVPNINWLWVFVYWPVFLVCVFSISLCLAILTPRFVDIEPMITSLMTVGFFLTPVMWRPSDLQDHHFIANFNPLGQLIAIFRDPLLGQAPELYSVIFALGTTCVFVLLAIYFLARFSDRVAYWL